MTIGLEEKLWIQTTCRLGEGWAQPVFMPKTQYMSSESMAKNWLQDQLGTKAIRCHKLMERRQDKQFEQVTDLFKRHEKIHFPW